MQSKAMLRAYAELSIGCIGHAQALQGRVAGTEGGLEVVQMRVAGAEAGAAPLPGRPAAANACRSKRLALLPGAARRVWRS